MMLEGLKSSYIKDRIKKNPAKAGVQNDIFKA